MASIGWGIGGLCLSLNYPGCARQFWLHTQTDRVIFRFIICSRAFFVRALTKKKKFSLCRAVPEPISSPHQDAIVNAPVICKHGDPSLTTVNSEDFQQVSIYMSQLHEIMVLFVLCKLNSSNAHAHPCSGARCLIFGLTLHLLPYFMCAKSQGSGEPQRLWRDCTDMQVCLSLHWSPVW